MVLNSNRDGATVKQISKFRKSDSFYKYDKNVYMLLFYVFGNDSKYSLQFEVCRFINTQSGLKIPFQIAKSFENDKNVVKIIFRYSK